MNRKRHIKGKLGHVVQIRTWDLGITLRRLACVNFVTWVAVFTLVGSFLTLPTRKAIRYSMKNNPICKLPLSRSARCTFAPLTLSALPNLAKGKFRPNFILWNFEKQIAPCVSTGRELLFEWSHHRIWSTDSKVRVTLKNSIKHSDSERVKVNFNCRVIFPYVRT